MRNSFTCGPLAERSPFGASAFPPSAFLDLDFAQDRNFLSGAVQPFNDVFDYSATGLGTFTDKTGKLVWNAHNLVLNSEAPADQVVSVSAGVKYTIGIIGTGSVTLSDAGAGNVIEGAPVEFTASSTSLTLTLSGDVSRMWVYRSDLGGMADNPDNALGAGFEKYVPTGAVPVYKARRNAYVNGKAAGVRIESGASTNQAQHSHALDTATWGPANGVTVAAAGEIAGIPAWEVEDTTVAYGFLSQQLGAIPAVSCTSFRVQKTSGATSQFGVRLFLGVGQFCGITFNVETGVISNAWNDGLLDRGVLDMGDHWFAWFAVDMGLITDPSSNVPLHVFPAHNDPAGVPSANNTGKHVCTAFQLEAGASPSSYVPTTGSQVTRPAETLAIKAAVLPAVMPAAVSFVVKGMMSYADQDGFSVVEPFNWELNGSNSILMLLNCGGSATGSMWFRQRTVSGMVTAKSANDAFAPGVDVPFSVAARHGDGFAGGAVKGTVYNDTAAYPIPDLAGAPLEVGALMNGYLTSFRMWDRDIGDNGIGRVSA